MVPDIIGIWGQFYFGHTINQSSPDTIVDNRHFSEGEKLLAIFAISPIIIPLFVFSVSSLHVLHRTATFIFVLLVQYLGSFLYCVPHLDAIPKEYFYTKIELDFQLD
jgi:hypothetical protein